MIHQPDIGIALSYEEFEAAFAQSGTEYTTSQCSYQAQDPCPTASPLPEDPRIHGWSYDSERSNDAGHSPYWSAAKDKCQADLTRESDATRALSLSSQTNDLSRRQPDPPGRDNPFSPEYSSQITGADLCSSCREQARENNSSTLCSACRSKITATLDSRARSPSSYSSAVSVGASLLVGVVASGVGAEFAARAAIQSLRR